MLFQCTTISGVTTVVPAEEAVCKCMSYSIQVDMSELKN